MNTGEMKYIESYWGNSRNEFSHKSTLPETTKQMENKQTKNQYCVYTPNKMQFVLQAFMITHLWGFLKTKNDLEKSKEKWKIVLSFELRK